MEASPLLSGYVLAAEIAVAPAPDVVRVLTPNGDFAAGCRRRSSALLKGGRFATGMTVTPMALHVGTFASGTSSETSRVTVCGNFATGQRVGPLIR
jgi:hypothetical protein